MPRVGSLINMVKILENLSKIQRLNIELKSIDEENKRIQNEIENLKSNLSVINEDQDKEKSIILFYILQSNQPNWQNN